MIGIIIEDRKVVGEEKEKIKLKVYICSQMYIALISKIKNYDKVR